MKPTLLNRLTKFRPQKEHFDPEITTKVPFSLLSDEILASASLPRPFLRGKNTIRTIFAEVLGCETLLLLFGVYRFGFRALTIALISLLSCFTVEYLYALLRKKPQSVWDGSFAVTGLTLALLMPVHVPLWLLPIQAVLALLPGKLLFGGLYKNPVNPALFGRFLPALFLPSFLKPLELSEKAPLFSASASLLSEATDGSYALETLKNGALPEGVSATDLFLGNQTGLLGTVCAGLLLLCGLYLIWRRIISPEIPLAFLASVAVLSFLFPHNADGLMQKLLMNERIDFMLGQLLAGGLLFAAVFLANDPVTSPVTRTGRVLYGVGCGLITVVVRFFTEVPEGAFFAVLVMNLLSRPLDRLSVAFSRVATLPRVKPPTGGKQNDDFTS